MEMVAIVPHALLRAAAAIRIPIVAVADIPLPVAAVAADTRLLVAVEAAGIQLPAAAGVAVGSTPLAVTTRPIADDKNFELLPGGPPSRPLFLSSLSESSFARGAPT